MAAAIPLTSSTAFPLAPLSLSQGSLLLSAFAQHILTQDLCTGRSLKCAHGHNHCQTLQRVRLRFFRRRRHSPPGPLSPSRSLFLAITNSFLVLYFPWFVGLWEVGEVRPQVPSGERFRLRRIGWSLACSMQQRVLSVLFHRDLPAQHFLPRRECRGKVQNPHGDAQKVGECLPAQDCRLAWGREDIGTVSSCRLLLFP